ncbi:MAG: sulfatase-like hydrolase/transferase [Ardenticatenaceae bacterium]|nr:sulfatase-like hydrolase/transferase [Ardenticatenaceae bacterium]HBY94959.1 hypothetical protein [Chloroflexota bacterium]
MNRPNILLLTIDSLRLDMLGCYGYARATTPNLDRLAATGIRFTQAITGGSWTQAAFPALLTSSYPSMYGGCTGPLSPARPSPIETLASHGYTSAGFSTNPHLSRVTSYDRGFGHFRDLVPAEAGPRLRDMKGGERFLRNSLTHYALLAAGKRMRPARAYVSAQEVTDVICRWCDGAPVPFFLWVHYMDVHWPYHLEETLTDPRDIARAWRDLQHINRVTWRGATVTQSQREYYIRLYEQALYYVDTHIGRLLSSLERSGRLANTVVIVVSDHGEEFLDHGRWGHRQSNLYDEILRVPLLIRVPGNAGNKMVRHQVSTLDIMPTVLQLCDCPPPSGIEGASLVLLWDHSRGHSYEMTEAISEMHRDEWHRIAVRTEEFKYIWDNRHPDAAHLYDLQADPAERCNVIQQYPEAARSFQSRVDIHRRRVAETSAAIALPELELDETVISRLRGLGYIE